MTSTLLKISLIAIFILFFSNLKAQPRKGEFINISVGLGISSSYYNQDYENYEDIDGSGFYAQGEYVLGVTKWIGLRPYAGIILTSTNKDENQLNQHDYKVTSKAFLLGGKVRLCAPIPWIAPFVETGIGASIGKFENYTPTTNIKKNGLQIHIPFSFGLALGPKNNIEIAATYYFHPAAKEFCGALAAGFTFPID